MSDLNIATTNGQQKVASVVTDEFKQLVENQGYSVPDGYNVANALQGAVLAIGNDRNLATADLDSIKKTLFDMVVQGLSVSKTQAYFIKYGNQLQMQRSYFGTQAVLKRLPEIKDIKAHVVHSGDKFEIGYEDGELVVKDHETSFENLDNEIIGVYAVITKDDGTKEYEVMTKKQIDASWSQAKTKNVQNKFPEEMAKRTVINRAAKNIVNTSTADDALVNSINGTTKNEFDEAEVKDVTPQAKSMIEKLEKMNDAPVKKDIEDPEVEDVKAENRSVIEKMEQTQAQNVVDEPLFHDMTEMSDGYKSVGEDF